MSDTKLKCPFCQQELETWAKYTDGTSKVWCSKCNLFGDSKLFSELIRTRKALDVAVDALKDNLSQANFRQMLDASRFHCIRTKCESALAEITALEQKDK